MCLDSRAVTYDVICLLETQTDFLDVFPEEIALQKRILAEERLDHQSRKQSAMITEGRRLIR